MEDCCVTKNKSSSPNNKLEEFNSSLKIKLKLPKHEQQLLDLNKTNKSTSITIENKADEVDDEVEEGEIREEEEEEEPSPLTPNIVIGEVKLRICSFCKKTFNNGKALGGHMRIHTENYKSKQKSKSKSNFISSPSSTTKTIIRGSPSGSPSNDEPKRLFSCTLCPKKFPSLKSLFGHMRSHPDRVWRGMNPPQHYPNSKVNVAEKEEEEEPPLTWKVTGKRGRIGKDDSYSSPETSLSSASLGSREEAAANLMLLRVGGAKDYDEVEYEIKKAKKGKGLMFFDDNNVDNDEVYDDDEIYYLKNLGLLPNHKLNLPNDVDDEVIRVNPTVTPSKNKVIKNFEKPNHKWECTTCGKSFPTHQALGGHRSSHNRDKPIRIIDGSGSTETSPTSGGGGEGQAEVVGANDDDVAVHKCKICNKVFSSGQALGGHKRCHYVGGTDILSTQGLTGQASHSGLFDLNVEPTMMDDEDDEN